MHILSTKYANSSSVREGQQCAPLSPQKILEVEGSHNLHFLSKKSANSSSSREGQQCASPPEGDTASVLCAPSESIGGQETTSSCESSG